MEGNERGEIPNPTKKNAGQPGTGGGTVKLRLISVEIVPHFITLDETNSHILRFGRDEKERGVRATCVGRDPGDDVPMT